MTNLPPAPDADLFDDLYVRLDEFRVEWIRRHGSSGPAFFLAALSPLEKRLAEGIAAGDYPAWDRHGRPVAEGAPAEGLILRGGDILRAAWDAGLDDPRRRSGLSALFFRGRYYDGVRWSVREIEPVPAALAQMIRQAGRATRAGGPSTPRP